MNEHDINDCKKFGRHCKICFGEKSETINLMLFNSRNILINIYMEILYKYIFF